MPRQNASSRRRNTRHRTQDSERTDPPKRDVNASVRAQQAIDLFCEGLTYRAIATRLGYRSVSGVYEAIQRELELTAFPKVEQLRELEGRRLQALWAPYYRQALDGDLDAANLCIRIADRRCKLFGLDTPVESGAMNQPSVVVVEVGTSLEAL